jgi:hypothetical protein
MIHLDPDYGFLFRLIIGGSTYNYHPPANPLAVDRWSFISATYDGSYVRLFVGGIQVLETPRTGNLDPNTENLFIGIHPVLTAGRFNGLIDEVRIYSRALSQTEISDLYDNYPFEVPDNPEAIYKTIIRKYVSPEPSHGTWGIEEII